MPLNPSIGNVPRSLPFPQSPTLPQMPAAAPNRSYISVPPTQQLWTIQVSHDTAYVGPSRLGPDSLTTVQKR